MRRGRTADEAAITKLERIRWRDAPTCPRCGAQDAAERIVASGSPPWSWRCQACERPFQVTTGTVLEGIPLPLATFLAAVRRLRRAAVSTLETADTLGIDEGAATAIAALVARAEPRGKSFDGLLRALMTLPPIVRPVPAEPDQPGDPF